MKKLKICVYAISKNEEKFVQRWVDSMNEADAIYVLDTGSTDNTINLLKNNNVIVKKEIINPWRFDVARNKSLEMIPDDFDICVCTDLDEVLEKGWRDELEKNWISGNLCSDTAKASDHQKPEIAAKFISAHTKIRARVLEGHCIGVWINCNSRRAISAHTRD